MTTDHDARARPPLGVAVKERRESLGLTRADVHAHGGPSTAALARIENGETDPATIKTPTRTGIEKALRLPRGWISAYTAGQPLPVPAVAAVADISEAGGEQILVGIIEGSLRLEEEERRAVLTLVRALQRGNDRT